MELEELKADWKTLNERLERYEFINKQLMKETICSKGNTALEKLQNIEIFSTILCFASTLFLAGILLFKPTPFVIQINIIIAGIITFGGVIWCYRKYCYLSRIDISNMNILSIKKRIDTYKSWIFKENFFFYLILIPVINIIYQKKEAFSSKALIFYAITLVLITIALELFMLSRLRKQMKQINKTLTELKEFEEK